MRVKPVGEWNTMEVTARGKTLTLTVNGAIACEFTDCGVPKGRVGPDGEGYRINSATSSSSCRNEAGPRPFRRMLPPVFIERSRGMIPDGHCQHAQHGPAINRFAIRPLSR